MKSKKDLYPEAVERNLQTAELNRAPKHYGTKYVGLDLAKAKTKLGIKATDSQWDNRILKLIKPKV